MFIDWQLFGRTENKKILEEHLFSQCKGEDFR